MTFPHPRRSSAHRRFPIPVLAALGAAILLGALAAPAHAQTSIRPWTPPSADSLTVLAAEARVLFEANRGDSVVGSNYRPYEIVGILGRRLLRALGTTSAERAHEVEAALDSLGLDTDLVTDPSLPEFHLLIVHNPFQRGAGAVGYLYWRRGEDLRVQGVSFQGGRDARMRVWWTGERSHPYSLAVVEHDPVHDGRMRLLYFRLSPDGFAWNLEQYEGEGPDLGGPGEAQFVDVNRDGRPELVAWTHAVLDSAFEACRGCPALYNERLYTVRESGFELHDSRLLPSPFASFVLFIRLLREDNRAAARRLLADPSKLDEAVALGWARPGRGAWQLEYAEEGENWPHWLAFRFHGPRGTRQRYIVHFTMKDSRWIVREWIRVREDAAKPAATDTTSSARGRPPASNGARHP